MLGPSVLLLWGVAAQAAAPPVSETAAEQAIIITAPGNTSERDEAQSVDAATIRGSGRPDLLDALSRSVPALSLQDAEGNAFEPNLVYRGFTVSALQGQPQGLAVYIDGARFNQPFGETVHFDLVPSAAIERADIYDASPVFGLNALGGALVIQTKDGRSAPGAFASASTTEDGDKEAVAEVGWHGQHASAYLAIQANRDRGWRRYSPSSLLNSLLDLGWDGATAGVHVKADLADADLTGNGSAPIQLLQADYRAVFTRPDTTHDDYQHFSLHPWFRMGEHDRVQGTIYAQRYSQKASNGDLADIAACESDGSILCLETDADQQSPLIGSSGTTIAAHPRTYGLLNGSDTQTRAAGLLTQLTDRRKLGAGENVLVAGLSYDASRTGFNSQSELGALTDSREVIGLGPVVAQPDGSVTPVSLDARTAYLGLFAADQLPITRHLTANLGLRWNEAVIAMRDRIGSALSGRHRYDRLNPGAQLNWHFSPAVELRLGFSQANRSPSPAELACASAQDPCSLTDFFVADPPLKQVVTTSIELGGQGTVGPFKWLVSAYRSTNADDIQFVASPTRGRAFFQNVGKTRRQGVEASVSWHRGALDVQAGYASTDATFRTPLLLNSPDNPMSDDKGQIMVEPGDHIPGVPRQRAIFSATYGREAWNIGTDWQIASGSHFFGDEANLDRQTQGYVLARVTGSLRIVGPLWAFAEVRNLLDQHYGTYGTYSQTDQLSLPEVPGASDPRSITPGAPRTWLIGLKARL